MSTLVESLRRLFLNGKVTEEKLTQMAADGKLTAEEKSYITTPVPTPAEDEYKQYYDTVNSAILGGGN